MKKHVYRNNQSIAVLEYTLAADEAQIIDIIVDEKYRRQGIATQLINELLAEAKHCSYVILEVRESNQPARRLYAKHGFVEWYRRKNYYKNPTEDAIVMRRMV
jgi:[ribosomal protein S18]-alanine N-acetyltransferase